MSTALHLAARLIVVLGASSGIGRAVALTAARRGYELVIVGRNPERLAAVAEEARALGAEVTPCCVDLTDDQAEPVLVEALAGRPVRACVWSAGMHASGSVGPESDGQMEHLLMNNVAGATRAVRALLWPVRKASGDIVFVNSTQGVDASPSTSAYAASMHAIRALADALRREEFEHGVRVLTVYTGRTATPMQEAIFAAEQRPWTPEVLLQPEDVAEVIMGAIELPPRAEMTEVTLLPMWRASV